MILMNAIRAFSCFCSKGAQAANPRVKTKGFVDLGGVVLSSYGVPFAYYSNTATGEGRNIIYFGIALGKDNTPPTFTDTQIINPITSTELTSVDYSLSILGDYPVFTQTVRNKTQTAVTIKEVGIFGSQYANYSYSPFLFTRTVLDEPVVLNPGDTKTITVEIDMTKFVDNTYNT